MSPNDEIEKIYDITRKVGKTLAGWPGDTPYRFDIVCRISDGESVNVGSLSMSPHTGTHIDAPFHYSDDGATVGELDLEIYMGKAAVVRVEGKTIIQREDVPPQFIGVPRLLFRTGGWPNSAVFPTEIPVLASDMPPWLAEHGVVLIGLDLPSVDSLDSKDLPIHHLLGRSGIAILEGLDLTGVPEGVYELSAVPLRLEGADGSPVRAILRCYS